MIKLYQFYHKTLPFIITHCIWS